MPELERAYKVYAEDGLVILAVSLTEQDDLEDVRTFVEEFEITASTPCNMNPTMLEFHQCAFQKHSAINHSS